MKTNESLKVKLQEREKRRADTKRRNEERRKQREKAQLDRKMAMEGAYDLCLDTLKSVGKKGQPSTLKVIHNQHTIVL